MPDRDDPIEAASSEAARPPLYYRCHVFCCVNVRPPDHLQGSCYGRGAVRLRNYMKARAKELGLDDVRINQSGCLDRCGHGPTMVIYPDGVWYHYDSFADVDEILQTHAIGGRLVERLLIDPLPSKTPANTAV